MAGFFPENFRFFTDLEITGTDGSLIPIDDFDFSSYFFYSEPFFFKEREPEVL